MDPKQLTLNGRKYKFFIKGKYDNRRSSSAFIIIQHDDQYVSLQMISDVFFSFTGINEDVKEFILYAVDEENNHINLFDICYMIDDKYKILITNDFHLGFSYTPCPKSKQPAKTYIDGLLFISNPFIKIKTSSLLRKL